MFTLHSIKIDEFWYRYQASSEFNPDVNIIIGRNGTGKTTFMEIVESVISVDIDKIIESDFKKATVVLSDGSKKKTIKIEKVEKADSPFLYIDYQISRKKFPIRAVSMAENFPMHYKRRTLEESEHVKEELKSLVSLKSLSVNRLRNGDDFEIKDRRGKRIVPPLDYRLGQLRIELTQFRLEISQKERNISNQLQRDVLASILLGESENDVRIPREFDVKKEKRKLADAYRKLGAFDQKISKKISRHIEAIHSAIVNLNDDGEQLSGQDFEALQSYVRTKEIIDMSLDSELQIKEATKQLDLFLETLSSFIIDKSFIFVGGSLVVRNSDFDEIELEKLSSGEKQLMIILIETLLQKNEKCIYLTDEPELSLHIEWQRRILPAIKVLNPNAQIIAATHSPEVASNFKQHLMDMSRIVNG